MAAIPVTPIPGLSYEIVTGGEAQAVVSPGPNGGFITNPYSPADQGLSNVEVLYVNAIGDATLEGNDTTFAIQPGGTWTLIPGQTTGTTVNAASTGHKFSVTSW